jgi:hypothetical protein
MGALTVKDFCREYSVGATFAYGLIAGGALDARKAGKRTLISRESAERWFRSLSPMASGSMSYGPCYGQPAARFRNRADRDQAEATV